MKKNKLLTRPATLISFINTLREIKADTRVMYDSHLYAVQEGGHGVGRGVRIFVLIT